ncbi:Autophagy-related protein 18a (AtATG18a) (Protein PEROXISOME UNUSUAL POSITIONING 2) [Durusdinium trenchii]|uniref:Autophagy-related protein 18a (AtATG18a) (Protein PEROXISOME UNUSUAL POSITIONING 2) n=1 Tax=Durusdinium trenchii TaxID=1381693 RepID=A0ABP0M4T9_9DINO
MSLRFNQDNSFVVVALQNGFATFNTEPFSEDTRRLFENGGVGQAELLYRSNILALVGGGDVPQWSPNKVMLWDDTKARCVGDLGFNHAVRKVIMRRDLVTVVLDHRVYCYNFSDLQVRHSFKLPRNSNGLCELSLNPGNRVLVFPGEAVGSLCVNILASDEGKTVASRTIAAHESEITTIALNTDGSMLASASERGTLVRVFDTATGQCLHKLRRGTDRALIHCICFSADSSLLACSSDKCTVHVFTDLLDRSFAEPLQEEEGAATEKGSQQQGQEQQQEQLQQHPDETEGLPLSRFMPSKLASAVGQASTTLRANINEYLPSYFTDDARRSAVRFSVQQAVPVCAFGSTPNTILVAGLDGSFSQHIFDLETGNQERLFLGSIFANEK